MAIIRTAYDTRACRGYQSEVKSLSKALTVTIINAFADQEKYVFGLSTDIEDYHTQQIRPFLHPISLEYADKTYTVGDYRNYGVNKNGTFSAANDIEVRSLRMRCSLQQLWLTDSPVILRDFDTLPMAIYISWISENIVQRYGLDPQQRVNVSVIVGAYYYSLFKDKVDFTDQEEQMRLTSLITRVMPFRREDVNKIIDGFSTSFTSLDDLVSELVLAVPIQLAGFNIPLLYTLLANTWYTSNREVLPVAIEHPPTWVSLVYFACDNRAYRNTVIAKHALRRKPAELESFVRATNLVISQAERN